MYRIISSWLRASCLQSWGGLTEDEEEKVLKKKKKKRQRLLALPHGHHHRLPRVFLAAQASSEKMGPGPFPQVGCVNRQQQQRGPLSLTTDAVEGYFRRVLVLAAAPARPGFLIQSSSSRSRAVLGEGSSQNTSFPAIIGNKELAICFLLSFHLMEPPPSPKGLKDSLRRRCSLQLPFVSEMSFCWGI